MSEKLEQLQQLKKDLRIDEGKHNKPYKDTKGNWTIGIGYFIGQDLRDLYLSDGVIDLMVEEKIDSACKSATKIFTEEYFYSLSEARQNAIINLIFNMGEGNLEKGFRSFVETIPLMKKGLWHVAAINLSKSLWARDVDPNQRPNKGRDDRIIYMIETGGYHPEYLKG